MNKAETAQERDRRAAERWFHAAGVSGLIAAAMFALSAGMALFADIFPWMWDVFPYTFGAMCGFLVFAFAAVSGHRRALNRVKAHEDAYGAVGEERG